MTLNKRLSNRWMGRVGVSREQRARALRSDPAGIYDTNGNPTPTVTEPLVDGGQFAPQSGGSGAGTIYINAKWQFNANALYQAPYGIELSANVFGRQGYPFPIVRTGTAAALGADSGADGPPQPGDRHVPLSEPVEHRLPRRAGVPSRRHVERPADARRVQRASTPTPRWCGSTTSPSTNFNALAQNLSPRIARVGLVVGF